MSMNQFQQASYMNQMMQNPALMNGFQGLQQYMQPQQNAPAQNSIQYVNGYESALAYPLEPNRSVLLMDQNSDKFYIKVSDASGFCTVKKYRFEEEKETPEKNEDYVTKAEFDAFKKSIENRPAAQTGGKK